MKVQFVKAKTVTEYFNLPLKERTILGFWYKKPYSMQWLGFPNKDEQGWDGWEKEIKRRYPIQSFIRNLITNIGYEIRFIKDKLRDWQIWLFNPQHKDIRRAVPRNWRDICTLVTEVNFAMIKSFYKEANESCIDWETSPQSTEFKKTLDLAYQYITIERPELQNQMDNSYPSQEEGSNLPYGEAYKEVNRLEKLIEEKDTHFLTWFVKYRDYCWT